MLSNLTGWHAIIILAIVLLIFGAAKLPALAKSVGQSVRILQKEVKSGAKEKADVGTLEQEAASADAPSPVVVETSTPGTTANA
ncbi:MAG: twin-arginine translocase TatA/TatE family subunit [Microbacterium sp.]|uniref:twin-arginine translocase TatA/TatE family subunit n=1 Tax=Microbacterium sp. TaxID=51671 RepID=UPI001AD0BAB4|nr:twin-arginine translocase TatA/TatE family subunit [Microbacterium sp.]MBN9153987.1 twin-arginine translocase TatA/TatE family subunit [Microbacterium sp.]MBN9170168.1 twin-arginine translocase TatA/TatE family subunit [Microbacterium sp.]MBN9172491.1 twin-arginine translocase TatA/TatE family subunit [Microbacterium sp.]MBN9173610.1 twin-arginine translocase TatA/TatE family subunit [Microbacterium sp.]MBN9185587.1 twin-arginine translocase TatA/TatE family subunit [Microbacterium sp.]